MPPHPLPEGITPDRLLIATDLDGTLLSSSGRVGERTRGVLRRARTLGAVVVMATSRPLHDTERLVRPIADFLVCSSGAVTVDTACSRPIHREAFGHHRAAALCTSLRSAVPGVRLGLDLPNHCLMDAGFELGWDGADRVRRCAVVSVDSAPVLKVLVQIPEASGHAAAARAREVVGDSANIQAPSAVFAELLPPRVTKGQALQRILDTLPAPRLSLAFGDMPNDIPMLRWADIPVAVANAHPDVLASALFTTSSNDEEGVAEFLEHILDAVVG